MKHLLKRTLAILCTLALLMGVLPAAFAAEEPVKGNPDKLVVLSTTDMHGRCWDQNILNDTNVGNSMLQVSTLVKGIRSDYDNVILVDNGDLYQGTPISGYQLTLQKKGETELPNPMALCLKEIGYDYSVLGNHEFNYDWNLMENVRAYLADETKGNAVPTICANLYWDGTDGVHEKGTNVFTPYDIKTVTIGGEEHKIAVIGFENTDCVRWDIPDNYPGIVFSHPDNVHGSMAWEAEKYVNEVKEKGAEVVIVSYHSGLGDGADPDKIEFGKNSEGQVLSMIKNTEGIDMVIAGHDHSPSYSGNKYENKNGEKILVVNGGCVNLTKTTFGLNEEGKLVIEKHEDVSIKGPKGSPTAVDTELKEKIKPYVELASAYVNQKAGTLLPGDWGTSSNFYLQQTDTMDLVNRAQIAGGTKYLAQKYDTEDKVSALYEKTGLDHLTVDMSSSSVVVDHGYTVRAGDLSMKDIYKFYRYDNTLYLLPLTGQQIKDILEFNASERLTVNTVSGTPVYSCIGDSFTNPVFYGLDFVYDMSEEPGNRAEITGFANGNEFELDKTYIFAVNNYHLGNGPFAKYSTDDAIWSQTDDLGGGTVQDLIAEWLKAETEANGGVKPAPSHWKLIYDAEITSKPATGKYIGEIAMPGAFLTGDQILLYHPGSNQLVTNTPSGNRLAPSTDVTSGKNEAGVVQAGTNDETAIFTVVKNEDGSLSFKDADGKYMTSGATGNSMSLEDEVTDCGKWECTATEGGYYLRNVGAAYNGNHNQYLEYYSGFTTFGLNAGGAAYTFQLFKLTKAEEPEDKLTYDDFTDLEEDIWYREGVEFVIDNGMMGGTGEGIFEPEGTLTRGMLVTILYRHAGEPSVEGHEIPFPDVKADQWYTDAVIWAAENKVVNGNEKGEFAPEDPITREQVAAILYRNDDSPEGKGDLSKFFDADQVSDWAEPAMKWAVGEGIINGDSGNLLPLNGATRAQIAAILQRHFTAK